MDRVTQAKIESLLYEIRSWEDDAPRPRLADLAARFKLDPMMIAAIGTSEGFCFGADGEGEDIDPNQTTQVMSAAAVAAD